MVKDIKRMAEEANIMIMEIEGSVLMASINNRTTNTINMSQTSFSLYLHNQWTDFHKLSCAGKPQMRAIRTYAGCTKATTND